MSHIVSIIIAVIGIAVGAGIFAMGVWYGQQLAHVKQQLSEAENRNGRSNRIRNGR